MYDADKDVAYSRPIAPIDFIHLDMMTSLI